MPIERYNELINNDLYTENEALKLRVNELGQALSDSKSSFDSLYRTYTYNIEEHSRQSKEKYRSVVQLGELQKYLLKEKDTLLKRIELFRVKKNSLKKLKYVVFIEFIGILFLLFKLSVL